MTKKRINTAKVDHSRAFSSSELKFKLSGTTYISDIKVKECDLPFCVRNFKLKQEDKLHK